MTSSHMSRVSNLAFVSKGKVSNGLIHLPSKANATSVARRITKDSTGAHFVGGEDSTKFLCIG